MTDKRIKVDCPFCHTPPEQIQIKIITNQHNQKGLNYGHIFCPNCGCMFAGNGKQNLIDKWNRR